MSVILRSPCLVLKIIQQRFNPQPLNSQERVSLKTLRQLKYSKYLTLLFQSSGADLYLFTKVLHNSYYMYN